MCTINQPRHLEDSFYEKYKFCKLTYVRFATCCFKYNGQIQNSKQPWFIVRSRVHGKAIIRLSTCHGDERHWPLHFIKSIVIKINTIVFGTNNNYLIIVVKYVDDNKQWKHICILQTFFDFFLNLITFKTIENNSEIVLFDFQKHHQIIKKTFN